MQRFIDIISNQNVQEVIMVVIVFALTFLLKIPIKYFTNKLVLGLKVENFESSEHYKIASEHRQKIRKILNKTILLLPFALGILSQYICSTILKTSFDAVTGMTIGTGAITMYAFLEKAMYGKSEIEEQYTSEEGQAVLNAIETKVEKSIVEEEDERKIAFKEAFEKFKNS